MSKALGLNSSESRRFFEIVESEKLKSLGELATSFKPSQKRITEDTFRLIAEWQHFAILNLIDCEGFLWKPTYVAKRLGLSQAQAKLAMDLLVRAGLVKLEGSRAKGVDDAIVFDEGVPSSAVRSFHKQMLQKSIDALDLQPIDEREMNGVGFAIDPKKIPQMKRELSTFLDELISKHSKGKRHEVYFLETALFQLTRRERNDHK